MATRASVFQAVQLGLEVTPGTLVAANKRLLGTSLVPRPDIPGGIFRPVNAKVPTDVVLQKELSQAEWAMPEVCFNDFAYICAAALTKLSNFVFNGVAFGPETIQTYSFDVGSSVGAERFTYGFVNSIALRMSETEFSARGTFMGLGPLGEGITMTPTPTDVPAIACDPKGTGLFIGDTVAGLARVTRYLEGGFTLNNIRGPLMTLDESQPSFTDTVEGVVDPGATLTLEHNAFSAGLTADLRLKKTKFVRFVNVGAEYSVGNPYKIQITFPCKLRNPNRGPRNTVFGATYDLQPVYDSTFGKYLEIIVLTNMSAL